MKIIHLKHHEIDRVKWDKCIDNAFNGIAYAYSWYLDIVCNNWEALVEDDYVSVFPLTGGKKYGISYLYQPYFTQHLGLFSINNTDTKKVNTFLNAIPSRYKFIEIKLSPFNDLNLPEICSWANNNYELPLNSPYEKLYKSYSTNTKRNLKRANKNSLSIRKDLDPSDLIQLFRNNKGKEFRNLKTKDYNKLLKLISTCIMKKTGEIYSVYTPENELCAAAFFTFSHNRWIFLFSGTNDTAKQNGGMTFLIDSFIKEHSGKNLILDFEGSNDNGLARFYKNFGSLKKNYLSIKKNNLPYLLRLIKE